MKYMVFLCCFLLPACSLISTQGYGDPDTGFPARFSGSAPAGSREIVWKQSFPDNALESDIQMLTRDNFEISAARARVEQAAAEYHISRSALFPSLEAGADFERSRVRQNLRNSTDSLISFGSLLNWEPDIWGRLRRKKEAADLTLAARKETVKDIALNLQTLLVEAWVAHHGARRLEKVLTDLQTTNLDFLNLTELRLLRGYGNSLDVLRQRGRLKAVKRELQPVISQKSRTANAYAVLLGHMPGHIQMTPAPWTDIAPLPVLPTPASLLNSRPDLRAAFLSLRAADQQVAAAVADRLPKIAIGLDYSLTGTALSGIGDSSILTFTSGLLAPVFDAGKRMAAVSRRRAQAREALADMEQAMLNAVQEVENGLSRESSLLEELALLAGEIKTAEQTVENARFQYVKGREDYLTVLDALEKFQTLLQLEITLEQEAALNRARLLKALGASWNVKATTGQSTNGKIKNEAD